MDIRFTFFILIIFFTQGNSQDMGDSQKLEDEIKVLFSATNGDFALAFKNMDEGNDQVFINEHEQFHAASTMKTPVMIEIYKQAQDGVFSLNDSILVKNEFKSIVDGSPYSMDIGRDDGEHIYQQMGQKRSIRSLLIDMIIYSSNLATNILIELVEAKNVNATMRAWGAKDINVLRGVEDMKAFDAGLNNTTTAYDLLVIFEKLARGEGVSKEASDEMISILMNQTHKDIIPAKLPDGVKVANKTGFITGVHHDSGIVYLPDGRSYVLVLLSKNMEDSERGTKMLAEVSRLVYEYVKVE